MPAWFSPLQETASRWSEHKDARLGAALAYYSIFSIGPLIIIAITIAGLVFGAEAVQAQVFGALHGLLGDSGTQAIDAMLKGANRPREGIFATVIGVGALVFAAVGVVVQLKDALNMCGRSRVRPDRASGASCEPIFGRSLACCRSAFCFWFPCC
jgi:membrane protein